MHMQKATLVVGFVCLLVVWEGGNLVYSQPAGLTEAGQTSSMRLGRNLSLTIGLDVWPNQWITTVGGSTLRFSPSGDTIERVGTSVATAFSVGLIPTATLVYQRFFASVSYMWTADYNFGTTEQITLDPSDTFGTSISNLRTTASRQEVDFTVGYFPLDWLGVAIGYKGIFQEFDSEGFNVLTGGHIDTSTFKFNANGIVFGVLVSARIDDRFSLIGNAFGGYLVSNCSTTPESANIFEGCVFLGNNLYEASKLVLRYEPAPQVSITLGYRVQIISNMNADEVRLTSGEVIKVDDVSGHGLDVTHGPVIGVNLRF
jgi:hypothetical protein